MNGAQNLRSCKCVYENKSTAKEVTIVPSNCPVTALRIELHLSS
jgi:hypothetical protein